MPKNKITLPDRDGVPYAVPAKETFPGSGVYTVGSPGQNVVTGFRDSFESYDTTNLWSEVQKASGDLILLDGNAAAASYLVVSLDPLTPGTETRIESRYTFYPPIELVVGAHMSQRVLGQEFAVEAVSTEPNLTAYTDVAISSVSQTTTTITVTTALAHGLIPGQRIGLYGISDSRLNYPSLVVDTVVNATQFTATAGPAGAIPSVTAGPFTSGFVYARSAMGYAQNGTSMIFENGTATNASLYVRADAGDALPTGTILGNHSVAVNTTVSVQAIARYLAYAFQPTSEYRLLLAPDMVNWMGGGVDSIAVLPTNIVKRTQVVPSPNFPYKVRIRATNNKGLTAPVAQIVSVAKTGTTTATITFDRNHNLTVTDLIVAYGVRDQTNFANLTTATAVAAVVNATTIQVVWGAAVTATSFGGYVSRVNGGQVQQGAIAQVIQTAQVTAQNVLTLVGSAAWSGLLIGDYVNGIAIRDNTTGASLGLDGAYRVRNASTTTLELEPIDGRTLTAGALQNCGGAIIKRTDLRLSYVRVFDYERERVELIRTASGDVSVAQSVQVNNTPNVSITGNPILGAGTNQIGATLDRLDIPQLVNDVASAALTTTTTTAAFTPGYGTEYEVNIPVTAVSGTTPTLDVVIQESDDAGTNWYDVYHFPRITATGMYRSPKIALKGNRVRYVQTVAGTTPSFTRAVNRLQSNSGTAVAQRRLFDRAVVLTTLNAATAAINMQECTHVQLAVNIGTATTPPALQLQGSDDGGVSWYNLGTPLTAVASSTVQLTLADINAELVRAVVSTAGATVVAGYVEIKGY